MHRSFRALRHTTDRRMRLLVLGGTVFLGRHTVEAALARGHEVTIFTRGQHGNPWGAKVEQRLGNRDPRNDAGLASLERGAWDAVIDTSGYLPRCVRASAELLAQRAPFYLFVSSMSVYADASRPGVNEDAPLASLPDPATEAVAEHYGALKAACEAVVREVYGEPCALVRPGLIVGPHDPTDRFAYWPARFRAPDLLGDRPARAVVPAPASRPIQVIDARDLAGWMLDVVESGTRGVYNACSRAGQWTMGDLVDALGAGDAGVTPAWLDDEMLIEHGVTPWTGLPLWLPLDDPEHRGFFAFDCERAHRAGLRSRPLVDTVDDTAAWLATRDAAGTFAHLLGADAERALLAGHGTRGGGSVPSSGV